MNTENKIRKSLTKGDILLITGVIAVCVLWFFSSFSDSGESLRLVIYKDGEVVQSINLDELDGAVTFTVDSCEIYADKDGARFNHSDCPDGLCVKRGLLTESSDVMACVPQRVVICLQGTQNADIVAY